MIVYGWQIMLFIAVWVCIAAGAMFAAFTTAIWAVKKLWAMLKK